MSDKNVAVEPFDLQETDSQSAEALGGGNVRVKPSVSIHGADAKIKLLIDIPDLGSDTKTYSLTPANKWTQSHDYLSGIKKFTVKLSANTSKRDIEVSVTKKTFVKDIDLYTGRFPYSNLKLPSDFSRWNKVDPKMLAQMKSAWPHAKDIDSKGNVRMTDNRSAVDDACRMLGAPGFVDGVAKALAAGGGLDDGVALSSSENTSLYAFGIIEDAAIFYGGMIGTGMYITNTGHAGWYSTAAFADGTVVGMSAQIVLSIVWSRNGKDALQNFADYKLRRGVAGYGYAGSIGLLGDSTADACGLIVGGGIGIGAGEYTATAKQFVMDF